MNIQATKRDIDKEGLKLSKDKAIDLVKGALGKELAFVFDSKSRTAILVIHTKTGEMK